MGLCLGDGFGFCGFDVGATVWLGGEETAEEGAGRLFYWLEKDAGEETAVVGCEGVGALGRERGEGCDQVAVAACLELLEY